MKNNKIALGWVTIGLGLLPIIITGLLATRIDNNIVRVLSPVSCSIFGGCLAAGCGMIYRGMSSEASKKYDVEQHDERNVIIRGKAGCIAFFVLVFLTLAYSVYIFYIKNDMVSGFIGYGIVGVCLLIYTVLYGVFKKIM